MSLVLQLNGMLMYRIGPSFCIAAKINLYTIFFSQNLQLFIHTNVLINQSHMGYQIHMY
jgi:hypothetical protein